MTPSGKLSSPPVSRSARGAATSESHHGTLLVATGGSGPGASRGTPPGKPALTGGMVRSGGAAATGGVGVGSPVPGGGAAGPYVGGGCGPVPVIGAGGT